MIDRNLQAAQQASRRDVVLRVIIVVLLVLIAVGVMAGYQYLSEPDQPETVVENALELDEESPEPAPAARQTDAARESFMAALAVFTEAVKPLTEAPGLADWAPQRLAEALAQEEAAVIAFAQEDYSLALDRLAEAEAGIRALYQDWNAAFDEQLAAAEAAFAADDAARAGLAVDRALSIRPGDDAATALASRIAALPEVLRLLERARIADIENNVAREIAELREVLAIDPAREAARSRLQQLEGMIDDERFAAEIRRAEGALSGGDLTTARQALAAAQRIRPGSVETQSLAERLGSAERDQRLDALLADLDRAAETDRWGEVVEASRRGLSEFVGHPRLQAMLDLATDIKAAQDRLRPFIRDPDRLSDPAIRNAAQAAMEQSAALAPLSPTLQEALTGIDEQLALYTRKVPVFVRSDGQTEIRVIGVGRVGLTEGRTIELTPGDYVLEGRRQGYRSKRVPLRVPPDAAAPISVEVITDEQI